jgi:hypothetical protein
VHLLKSMAFQTGSSCFHTHRLRLDLYKSLQIFLQLRSSPHQEGKDMDTGGQYRYTFKEKLNLGISSLSFQMQIGLLSITKN